MIQSWCSFLGSLSNHTASRSIVVAPVLDILIYAEPAKKVFSQGVFAFVANIIIVGVLGSLLGLGYTKIGAKSSSLTKED